MTRTCTGACTVGPPSLVVCLQRLERLATKFEVFVFCFSCRTFWDANFKSVDLPPLTGITESRLSRGLLSKSTSRVALHPATCMCLETFFQIVLGYMFIGPEWINKAVMVSSDRTFQFVLHYFCVFKASCS